MTRDERSAAMDDIATAAKAAHEHAVRLRLQMPLDEDVCALTHAVAEIAREASRPYPDLAAISELIRAVRDRLAPAIDGGIVPERAKPEFTANEAARHELDRVRNMIGAVWGNVGYVLALNKEGD